MEIVVPRMNGSLDGIGILPRPGLDKTIPILEDSRGKALSGYGILMNVYETLASW